MASLDLANAALKELDRLRKEQELVIRKINQYHAKLQACTFCPLSLLVPLLFLYVFSALWGYASFDHNLNCLSSVS